MPPKGTAGLARSAVSGISRLPSPPARTMARTLGLPECFDMVGTVCASSPRGDPCSSTSVTRVRVDILSKEYPPQIYGGAGVHVAELVRALRARGDIDARVRCFGGPRDEPGTTGYDDLPQLGDANPALQTLGVDLGMAADCVGADLVHSHTWYANMAGHLGSLLAGIPHVVSAHSLEPLRPWKAEQLGGGYAISSWAERTAYESAAGIIAVSGGMRADGVYPARRSVVFVGRITRQKGLPYFLRAARSLPPEVQVVLCAGAPDTPEIMAEVEGLIADLRQTRDGVVWIPEMLPRAEVVALLSAGTVFACPSVYEPLGIVNLEAMACELAVVATATGGIPEVVVHGETGWLVPIEQVDDGSGTPVDPDAFVADLAAALTEAVSDPDRARAFGRAGRARAVEHFSWGSIGDQTLEVYRSVLA